MCSPGQFDFKGEDGKVYNLLSTENITVNGHVTHDTFLSPIPNGAAKQVVVHGSFFTEMYLNMATGTNHSLQVMYKAGKEQIAPKVVVAGHTVSLRIDSALGVDKDGTFFVDSDAPTKEMPDTMVKFTSTDIDGEHRVQAINAAWTVNADSKYYPLREANGDKQRLDISFVPKMSKLGKVAPHGLIGQTFDFDGTAVDGARDDYNDKVVTTRASTPAAFERSSVAPIPVLPPHAA